MSELKFVFQMGYQFGDVQDRFSEMDKLKFGGVLNE